MDTKKPDAIPEGAAKLAHYRRSVPTVVEVIRYTPTLVVCRTSFGMEVRFNRKTGAEVNGGYGYRASELTLAAMEEINIAVLNKQIGDAAFALADLSTKVANKDRRGVESEALREQLKTISEMANRLKHLLGNA